MDKTDTTAYTVDPHFESTSYFCNFRKNGLNDLEKDEPKKTEKGEKVQLSTKSGYEVMKNLKTTYAETHVKKFDFQYGQYHQSIPNPANGCDGQFITVQIVNKKAINGNPDLKE
jgi:hypothetical protein